MEMLVRPARAGRRPRGTLWVLRVLATLQLVAVLAQPVLAGLFLVGEVDAMGTHALVGGVLAGLALAVIGSALALVVAGGRWGAVPVPVVLFVAIGGQMAAGYSRALQVHVPLGVAIVVGAVLFAVWVWTPGAARARGGAR